MAGILSYFLPKDKVFYSLFEQASDNLEAIAKKLVQVVQEPDFGKRAAHISEMQDQPYNELTSAYAKGKQLAESMCMQSATVGSCTPIIARLFTFSGHVVGVEQFACNKSI